jgi:hypothetical protein
MGENFKGDKVPRIDKLIKDGAGELKALATGTEYEGGSGDWGLLPDYVLRSVLPLSAADPVADVVSGKATVGEAATDFSISSVGAKQSPMSLTEQRNVLRGNVIKELLAEDAFPEEIAAVYQNTEWAKLSSTEKKVIDRAIAERYPEQEKEYRETRANEGDIFATIAKWADDDRAATAREYDILLERLQAGDSPRDVWEAYDDAKNRLAGAMVKNYEGTLNADGTRTASKETAEYRAAIDRLSTSEDDIRIIEDGYNQIVSDVFNAKAGALSDKDWEAIEAGQQAYIDALVEIDPDLGARFQWNLDMKKSLAADEAHDLTKLKIEAQEALQPYYDMPEDDPRRDIFLIQNPEADVLKWLTSNTDEPTLHSVSALKSAMEMLPNSPNVRLAGSTQEVTPKSLTIMEKYDKQITRFNSLPTSAVDAKGTYNPRTELRKQDPLYDALYYWLGYSKPAKGETSVSVYHLEAVLAYLEEWGPRSDKVKIRQYR